MLFQSKNPYYHYLKKKWSARHQQVQNKLWDTHQEIFDWLAKTVPVKQLAASSLGGILLLSTPAGLMLPEPTHLLVSGDYVVKDTNNNVLLAAKLQEVLPTEVRSLTSEEEEKIVTVLSNRLGFQVTAELEGKRLNRSYGLIGGEQHLYRYPGDTVYNHAGNASEWAMFGTTGIAPGLGAWGYFAPSKKEFTEKDKLREQYYMVVQTFLSPGFAENVAEYRDFFKYRKMVMVNPKNGQVVVGVIGDAGPGASTGKHYGGSPEVMHYLGLATGSRKGEVLCFFINDVEDRIQLGPVSLESNAGEN